MNNDDDNASGSDDSGETALSVENDLAKIYPLGPYDGQCCTCPEHQTREGTQSAELVSLSGNLALYDDAGKVTAFGGTAQAGVPVYVEGLSAGTSVNGDRALWAWTDADGHAHTVTNAFTVFSVRLFGDLNLDGYVDAADKAFAPSLSKEYGWGMPAATNVFRRVRLRTDVRVPGVFALSLSGDANAFRVWATDTPGTSDVPLLSGGKTSADAADYAGYGYTDLFVEALSNGTATLKYAYTGTGAADGLSCSASLKMTAWNFSLRADTDRADTDRDGVIDDNDEAGKNTNTVSRGILITPPLRELTDTGNDITGLATVKIRAQPIGSVPGLTLRLKKTYEPDGCVLYLVSTNGTRLPHFGSGQSCELTPWPDHDLTLAVMPQYARPLGTNVWPVRFGLELQAVNTNSDIVCRDAIQLNVAPMILPPECNAPEKIYTTAIEGIPGVTNVGATDAEVWAQDMVKFGKYQIRNGEIGNMFVDLEHSGRGSFPDKLRSEESWNGTNVWPVSMQGDGGNIMATPPLPDAPFGKLLIGSAKAGKPDPLPYWEGQGVQPAVRITDDWLLVGHVDEILMWVVPDKVLYADPWKAADLLHQEIAAGHQTNSLWFGFNEDGKNKTIQDVVIASDGSGFKLVSLPMPGLSNSVAPATLVFSNSVFAEDDILRVDDEILKVASVSGSTVTVARAQAGRPTATHTAGTIIYAYTDVMQNNLTIGAASIAAKIATVTNQLHQALNGYSTALVPMPVIFEYTTVNGVSGYTAKSANVVNCLLSSNGMICYTETGSIAFRGYISSVLPSAEEVQGSWSLHCLKGEIHCATTAQRELDLDPSWWQQVDDWE